MKIVGYYPFNDKNDIIKKNYASSLVEVNQVVEAIDASVCITKPSKEKTMLGKMLYAPITLNQHFKREFHNRGWEPIRVKCDYPTQYYVGGYTAPRVSRGAFREIDAVKDWVGVEVQFGKYAFMVYNVAAKMTIFSNLGLIKVGIEIVPVKELAENMSSGVSYFEQFLWDLEKRGVSNIDIPVAIIGISA